MILDFNQLKELLDEVSKSDISELSLEYKDTKIALKKNLTITDVSVTRNFIKNVAIEPQVEITKEPIPVTKPTETVNNNSGSNSNHVVITSPMVGTFYRAPSPTAKPFVEVGDKINPGQTICIIEAMKLMNDMPSEVSGKIVKILVDNGTTVEFGQNLFLVDPKG